YSHTKEVETSRMNLLLADMRNLNQKINEGLASDEDKSSRISKLVKWEVEGDENSKFFHGLINSKRKSQSIHGIMHEGVWLSDPKDIKEAFLNFYKKKFSCHDSQVSFPYFMHAHRLNTSDQDLLEAVVSMEEIMTAVWDCGSNKAPGRQILDGPLILSEIIDWYKKRKKKLMLFKVDFEKAFDSVSWKYLDYMLHKLGFGSRWRTWINNCLMSARTSILINGSPTLEFSLKRGLRQGDPLSPFLFIIVMEGLHMALNDGIASNMFHGVRIVKLSPWLHVLVVKQGSHEISKKLLWVKWSNTPASFDKGGLGVGSLSAFNKVLLLKWRWHLFNFLNSLWVQDCCRPITMGRSKTEFDNLIIDISNMGIEDLVESDTCVWSLSNDDSFSVNSVRKHIDEHFLPSLFPCTRWYKMIPKKVNVFMWRMLLDRLPNRLNLSSRGLDIDSISCMVCNGHVESNDHIFFTCNTAVAIWNLVRSWIDLPLPSFLSCEDWTNWFDSWHVSKDKKRRMYSIFAATCWTLWRFRNNITFNSHSMRKCDIFDFIRNVSFSWLKYRGLTPQQNKISKTLSPGHRISNEITSKEKHWIAIVHL
nr:RNA-directed DNA polymerase, eukaryota, reverse transcriptase zinc-binding domain protein [Tanacetum cinerariifolium]